jgi:hypothetical protein
MNNFAMLRPSDRTDAESQRHYRQCHSETARSAPVTGEYALTVAAPLWSHSGNVRLRGSPRCRLCDNQETAACQVAQTLACMLPADSATDVRHGPDVVCPVLAEARVHPSPPKKTRQQHP